MRYYENTAIRSSPTNLKFQVLLFKKVHFIVNMIIGADITGFIFNTSVNSTSMKQ